VGARRRGAPPRGAAVVTGSRPLPRDDVRALEGYHSPQLDVDVRLNTNESPYAPPTAFVDRWLAALRGVDWNRYPDRSATDLRVALGRFLGQPPERLLCGNGSNEILQTVLLTYGGPGRRALMFEPTYALHSQIARGTGTEVVAGERRADYRIDPEDATAVIEQARPSVVFVCSPNNPTGTVEPRDTVERLAGAAAGSGALLVVDEAYGEFAPWSAVELVSDDLPLAVVRTYSKVWSLAGLRLGFVVAPTWMIGQLEKVLLPYNLSVPTQLAGTIALDFAAEMEQRVASLVEERGRLFAALAATAGIDVCPSGANFLLFRVDGDAHELWKRLLARDVLVRDFSSWPRIEGCLRVTVGTPEENDAFLAALGEALPEVVT
jgi:histidinol-phosphate aminotransferase